MTPQELIKMLVPAIGELIDARIRTAEVTIKANVDSANKSLEERMKANTKAAIDAAMKASEERLGKKIDKIAERLDKHEERIERVEEKLGITQHN